MTYCTPELKKCRPKIIFFMPPNFQVMCAVSLYYSCVVICSTASEDVTSACRREWAEGWCTNSIYTADRYNVCIVCVWLLSGRGIVWTPRNKPERFRDRIKECEVSTQHAQVVVCVCVCVCVGVCVCGCEAIVCYCRSFLPHTLQST